MNTDRKWVIVRIDGKIAAISTDYRMLADISARLAAPAGQSKTKERRSQNLIPGRDNSNNRRI